MLLAIQGLGSALEGTEKFNLKIYLRPGGATRKVGRRINVSARQTEKLAGDLTIFSFNFEDLYTLP